MKTFNVLINHVGLLGGLERDNNSLGGDKPGFWWSVSLDFSMIKNITNNTEFILIDKPIARMHKKNK
jgi:hypothetical protein